MRYPSAILLVFAFATATTAQFTIACDQNRIGDMATLSLSGGFQNSAYVVLADTDRGPTFFPTVSLTVDLGLSGDLVVFEPGFIGPAGTGSMGFGFNEVTAFGKPYYAQALNVDPMNIFNIVASNRIEAAVHPPDIAGGTVTNLVMTDDSSTQVPLGFSFPFFGQSYTQVFVNSNGNLTFGGANPSFFVQESLFLGGLPCIAAFWCDLNPEFGGTVSTDTTIAPGFALSVSWTNLPHNFEAGTSTATVTMFVNGDVTLEYGATSVTDVIIGITPGMSAAPNALDLSIPGFESNPSMTSAYEVFGSSNAFDVAGKLVSFAAEGPGYLSYY